METYKIEANPYGYKQKDIAASGKEFLIGISGSEDLFVRSQTVAFKNKGTNENNSLFLWSS
jgi:hypothetical protein